MPDDEPKVILQRWRAREPVDHRRLNQSVDAINRLTSGVNPARQDTPVKPAAAVFAIEQFQVIDAVTGATTRTVPTTHDHIVCKRYNGTEQSGEAVNIALPYLLRRTPFDGETRNGITYTYDEEQDPMEREADDGSETETQVVVPSFVTGDIVYAARPITGGVAVTVEAGGETYNLEWLLFPDSRAWSLKSE